MASIPRGIYFIAVANSVERQLLTNNDNHVTILPPGATPEIEQEWRVTPGKDGNIIIERPSRIFPTFYLTYQNAPKEPEEGNRVVTRLSEFPLNEWHFTPVGPNIFKLSVADSELGISISPITIFPPILELGKERQLEWRFERLRSVDDD